MSTADVWGWCLAMLSYPTLSSQLNVKFETAVTILSFHLFSYIFIDLTVCRNSDQNTQKVPFSYHKNMRTKTSIKLYLIRVFSSLNKIKRMIFDTSEIRHQKVLLYSKYFYKWIKIFDKKADNLKNDNYSPMAWHSLIAAVKQPRVN